MAILLVGMGLRVVRLLCGLKSAVLWMPSRAKRGDLVGGNGVEGDAALMRTKVRSPAGVIASEAWQSRWWEWG